MPARLPFTAAQAVSRARSQVGVTESPAGSNRTRYGAEMGFQGVAWCAIFQGWVWKVLGGDWRAWWASLGCTAPAAWAYCPALLNAGRRAGLSVPITQARAGDLVFLAFTSQSIRAGFPEHIELATGTLTNGSIPTIGGNTSSGTAGSQAAGGGVFARVRPGGQVVGVIRPTYAAPAVPSSRPAAPARRPAGAPTVGRVLALVAPNMHGADVLAVQGRVGATRDGSYGPKTRDAVLAFQRRYWPHDPSKADGRVGPDTTRALGLRWVG